jgi:hypothetical protein
MQIKITIKFWCCFSFVVFISVFFSSLIICLSYWCKGKGILWIDNTQGWKGVDKQEIPISLLKVWMTATFWESYLSGCIKIKKWILSLRNLALGIFSTEGKALDYVDKRHKHLLNIVMAKIRNYLRRDWLSQFCYIQTKEYTAAIEKLLGLEELISNKFHSHTIMWKCQIAAQWV